MATKRTSHYVLTWQNMELLKALMDAVYETEGAYIDALVTHPDKETGKPASLTFQLCMPIGDGWTTSGYVRYEETKEDEATGMAYPPEILEQETTDD
jgi:hypothetical protein